MSEFRKLSKKQDAVVNKILMAGILDKQEEKDFLSLIKKRKVETKCEVQDLELAEYMYNNIKYIAPKLKKPNLNRWGHKIYSIRVTDRVGYETLRMLIQKVYEDQFWATKILNPDNLRRHAQRLILQFKITDKTKIIENDMFEYNIPETNINYDEYNKYRNVSWD